METGRRGMQEMNRAAKKIALLASLLVMLLFILFVINQTAQVVQLARNVSAVFATVVFWSLPALYAALILVPVFMLLRLPRSLMPPASEDSPEFTRYLESLKKRLRSNTRLKNFDLSNRERIEDALTLLGKQADDIIQKTASTVFMSTAISQSGRLDAFLVLSAQSRMVWQIAHLYYQRPTLRDLIHLYANVAATAFMASELDDIDLNEQVQPVLSSTLGAMAGSVPGLQLAASLLVTSVLTGTANAFLSLRVGIIAKRYCGSLVIAEKKSLRRTAGAEAAKLLGSIVRQGTSRVSKMAWEVSKDRLGTMVSGAAGQVRGAGSSLLSRVGVRRSKRSHDPQT
jgi:hypothetical protein